MRRLGIVRRAGRGSRIGAALLVASVALCSVLVSSAGARIITAATGHKFGIVPAFHGSLSLNGSRSVARIAAAGTPTCDLQVDSQCASPMTYHNGPVQHGENIILFFWDPSGFSSAPGYVAGMQTWVSDLAAGDFRPGNVPGVQVGNPLSVTQEYYDHSGPGGANNFVPYAVDNGGTVIDTDAYPASGCTDSYTNASNQQVTLPTCLTAGQLYGEVSSYIQAHNLPVGIDTEYFMLTPQGVGTCADSTHCAYSTYCGWHTAFGSPSTPVLIADMPWQSGIPGCDLTGASSLHSTGIDPVVNTFSHELAETMTDPIPGSGWFGPGGGSDEIGDKCAYQFSVGQPAADPTGLSTAPGGQFYNTLLNGHDYLLQMEYDNRAGGCNQWDTDTQPTAAMSVPSQVSPGSPATFSLTGVSAPAGVAYVTWYFGDRAATRATSAGSVHHTYSSAGGRTVTAILTDNHGNELKLVRSLTVAGGAPNSVIAHAPTSVTVNTRYSIRLSGHAVGPETLYVFADYKGCAATPAIEHTRASGYIWAVQGNFSEIARGNSPRAGQDHLCAYLVKKAEPKNPTTGVLARDFVTFTIHH